MHINTTLNYSPNFYPKKRKLKQIKFIIFHYTGMKKEKDAISRLINIKSKVSSHYFIKKNGEILTLIPDSYIAWHAGISSWKNYKSINKYSIGIEISNGGHENNYKNYSEKKIKSIFKLFKYLIKKYKIKLKFILGHSDVAPDRKKDPGEKFPWQKLYKNKIGIWHDLNKEKLLNKRRKKISKIEQKIFIQNLIKIGYSRNIKRKDFNFLNKLIKAFQRRFRQELINGVIDQECLLISKNILKKFK